MKVALSSSNQNQKVDHLLAKPLRNQAFATPDKVMELVQKVHLIKGIVVTFINWLSVQ